MQAPFTIYQFYTDFPSSLLEGAIQLTSLAGQGIASLGLYLLMAVFPQTFTVVRHDCGCAHGPQALSHLSHNLVA